MVAGFGVYGLTSGQGNFFLKYKYVLMGTPSDEIEMELMSSEMDEKTKVF